MWQKKALKSGNLPGRLEEHEPLRNHIGCSPPHPPFSWHLMYLFCVRVWACGTTTHLKSSEDNWCKSVLSFCCAGPRGETQVLRLGRRYIYQPEPSSRLWAAYLKWTCLSHLQKSLFGTHSRKSSPSRWRRWPVLCGPPPLRLSSCRLLQMLGSPFTSTFIPASSKEKGNDDFLFLAEREGTDGHQGEGWTVTSRFLSYTVSNPPPWWKPRLRQWKF